ncbi:MAG TPA: flavodoxin family protein [Coriobacteriia bacterium]
MTPPLVLGIAGSPRRHGNSEQLLDACLAGVAEAGGTAEKLVVVDYGIQPCDGCNVCSSTGECWIRDRMQEVYPRLEEADAIVVSSPVFFATVPAVLKALYDRCQPFWARRWVLGEPPPERKRPGALLLARAGGDPYGFAGAILTTKSLFAVLGVSYDVELKVAGVDAATDIRSRPEALAEARGTGAVVVSAAAR